MRFIVVKNNTVREVLTKKEALTGGDISWEFDYVLQDPKKLYEEGDLIYIGDYGVKYSDSDFTENTLFDIEKYQKGV